MTDFDIETDDDDDQHSPVQDDDSSSHKGCCRTDKTFENYFDSLDMSFMIDPTQSRINDLVKRYPLEYESCKSKAREDFARPPV